MPSADWLHASQFEAMLSDLRPAIAKPPFSERKLRLVAVACCRKMWHLFPNDACRKVVVFAEQVADGKSDPADLIVHQREMEKFGEELGRHPAQFMVWAARECCNESAWEAAQNTAQELRDRLRKERGDDVARVEEIAQCQILLEIFRSPFEGDPCDEFPSRWTTAEVRLLCEDFMQTNDFREFNLMEEILKRAGCTNDVLSHVRQKTGHVRGCWVLDALLGHRMRVN